MVGMDTISADGTMVATDTISAVGTVMAMVIASHIIGPFTIIPLPVTRRFTMPGTRIWVLVWIPLILGNLSEDY